MIRKDVRKRISRQKILVTSLMLSVVVSLGTPLSVMAAPDTTYESSSGSQAQDGGGAAPDEGDGQGSETPSTPEPTPDPSPEPTPEPSPEPTPDPTPEPSPEPTPDPTPEPSPEPTPGPTPGTTPEPTPGTETPVDNSDRTPVRLNIDSYTQPILFNTIPKDYALAKVDSFVNIREEKSANSRIVGKLNRGGLCFIIADKDQEWIYVESGDVRGFIMRDFLILDDEARTQVEAIGEDKFSLADCLITSWDNKAYTYTMDTIRDVKTSSELRQSLLQFSQQFLGNPYVWGGESLTNGADCSGYVKQIFREFGYSLPRTSREQAEYGTKIPVADAQPGDLIFYSRPDGTIYHVLIYMGNGKAINAQSTNTGIVISDVDYGKAPWAVRVIDDENDTLAEKLSYNGGVRPSGEYLGRFKLTAYCNCEICCGKWSGGPTASGTKPTQGTTVAMGGIGFGTKLNIGGQVFTVEDRGTPYGHIDIYMNSHEEANIFGVQYADVYVQN